MIRHAAVVVLVTLFSCNNTNQNNYQQLTQTLVDCTSTLNDQQRAEIRQRIGADRKTALLDSIFKHKAEIGAFNGNVLIAQEGVVLYRRSFGYAQIENEDTLTAASKFQLASLSKTFTAVAILKLYELGKLSLEDSIQKFIPQFPYRGIQIKSLLAHRSGLPNYAYVLTDSVRKQNPFPTNADIVRWYCAVRPKPYNTPNRYFSYSNTNYALLATIVEKVSGLTFEDFLHNNIFNPLGMKDTWLITSKSDSLNSFRTVGYQYNRRLPKDNFDDVVGDKGVYSTADDIFKWYLALNGGCLLRPETLREAFTPRSFEKKGVKNYGYGFRMHVDEQTQAPKYIYHTGWWKGYNTLMWFSPQNKFVIILLSNRYNRSIYQIKPILEVLEGSNKIDEQIEQELF